MNFSFAQDTDTLRKITEYFDLGKRFYANDFQKMKILDLTDRGQLWKAIGASFPAYQILPDTNYITYVKCNLLASIYSVAKSAEIMPTSEADKDLCANLNVALDALWDTRNIGYYQFKAGERAALLNVGYTQVGWDEQSTEGSGENIIKGNIRLKNINPLRFMRDPYAENLQEGAWCCTWDEFHKSVFLNNADYRDAFKAYTAKMSNGQTIVPPVDAGPDEISKSGAKDYYTLVKWWTKNDDGSITEIHTVNNEAVLKKIDKIDPGIYPFAVLHCNLPAEALVGTSEPAKIFANDIAYNLMDSIALTAEYKNQHPPKFISDQSKLNVAAFAKHGDDADKTFVVSGNASEAVHFQQFPNISPYMSTLKQSLGYGIETVSGVDQKYTGRDTGSIITTGGTEEMLNRVTLIDTPKIVLYEDYCKQLTKLILCNMIKHCPSRKFFRRKPNSLEYKSVSVDFPKLDKETLFNYRISISSELPKNKQRIAAAATELLKEQAQYRQEGDSVNWITEEEWLMFQDLPNKEYMLERMGVQRWQNALEDVAQVLYQYSDLVKQGLTPDQAMQATAQTLQQTRQGVNPQQPVGPNPDLQAMAGGQQMPQV